MDNWELNGRRLVGSKVPLFLQFQAPIDFSSDAYFQTTSLQRLELPILNSSLAILIRYNYAVYTISTCASFLSSGISFLSWRLIVAAGTRLFCTSFAFVTLCLRRTAILGHGGLAATVGLLYQPHNSGLHYSQIIKCPTVKERGIAGYTEKHGLTTRATSSSVSLQRP